MASYTITAQFHNMTLVAIQKEISDKMEIYISSYLEERLALEEESSQPELLFPDNLLEFLNRFGIPSHHHYLYPSKWVMVNPVRHNVILPKLY